MKKRDYDGSLRKVWSDDKEVCFGVVGTVGDLLKEGSIALEVNELYLGDGIIGLWCLPRHSVDMLLTDPPYGTTRNLWDIPLSLPEF